jgi:glycosyltransferase involved in cell wall biosynthesis
MRNFSLAFIADGVDRSGGQERAAFEVMKRLAASIDVTVIANRCEPGVFDRVLWVRGRPARPAVLRTWSFARLSRVVERRARCTISNTVGAAAIDADVITAQFCHAAYRSRFAGLRGGSCVRTLYHRLAERSFVAEERHAYASPRLKRVIAVSQGTARELREFYGVPEEHIAVIPNGVDHSQFRPAASRTKKLELRRALGLPVDRFLVLFMGADWRRKGLCDAITAMAGLRDATLVVVGPGDPRTAADSIRRAGVAGQVHFAGPSRVPERYYAAADALVFPSRYEGFSLVTLEAAASGLPIVAHRINGTEELVRDGHNGWLVPTAPEAIGAKLQRLREDEQELRRLSAGALESSLPYAWDRIAAEQLRVLGVAAQLSAPRASVP